MRERCPPQLITTCNRWESWPRVTGEGKLVLTHISCSTQEIGPHLARGQRPWSCCQGRRWASSEGLRATELTLSPSPLPRSGVGEGKMPLTHSTPCCLWQASVLAPGVARERTSPAPHNCCKQESAGPVSSLGSTLEMTLLSQVSVKQPWGYDSRRADLFPLSNSPYSNQERGSCTMPGQNSRDGASDMGVGGGPRSEGPRAVELARSLL